MRITRRSTLALVLCALTGSGALAYTLSGSRWISPTTTFHIGMSGSSPSGVPWSSALHDAMQEWTNATAFEFVADPGYVDPCEGLRRNDNGGSFPLGNGDGRNGMDFTSTICGNAFGVGVLAMTLSFTSPGPLGFSLLTQTDIVFNSDVEWDIHSGNLRQPIDFRRVALHELGHALGLDHSDATATIMAANYGSTRSLQADDVNGVNALYGAAPCEVRDIVGSANLHDSLAAGDCRVSDLFGGSTDTSLVDVYRVTLAAETELDIAVQSNELDPVLILTDGKLGGIALHDDTPGSCNARIRRRLPAGEYRVLVNTYEEPAKCAGNVGAYNLIVSDAGPPLLGGIGNASGGASLASAVIGGGATVDGANYATYFAANDPIDVHGRIVVDPAHVGRPGRLFVLAVLGDGRRFAQNASGDFVRFTGDVRNLPARRSGTLRSVEEMDIVSDLRGTTSGLAGQHFGVYVGYALDSSPADLWYGREPIRFSIAPQ